FGLMGIGYASKGPVMRANEGGGIVTVFQIGGKMRKLRIVWTGFQQQYRACMILGHSCRAHVSSSPSPHHNDVITHGVSSAALTLSGSALYTSVMASSVRALGGCPKKNPQAL